MKELNKMHNVVWYGAEGTVEIDNVEVDEVTELIVIPLAPWADRALMGELLKAVGVERNLF